MSQQQVQAEARDRKVTSVPQVQMARGGTRDSLRGMSYDQQVQMLSTEGAGEGVADTGGGGGAGGGGGGAPGGGMMSVLGSIVPPTKKEQRKDKRERKRAERKGEEVEQPTTALLDVPAYEPTIHVPDRTPLALQWTDDEFALSWILDDRSTPLSDEKIAECKDLIAKVPAEKQPEWQRQLDNRVAREFDAKLVKSGADWVGRADANGWANSTDFAKLDPAWGPKAKKFVDALRKSGISVVVTAGLRHPLRARLMHYAWQVACGAETPQAANAGCHSHGIMVQWDHGDIAASKQAAADLKGAFHLVHCASLTSNHMSGHAIDIEISNVGWKDVVIDDVSYQPKPPGGSEAFRVAEIGAAVGVNWYGASDHVHWSQSGG